MLEWAKTLLTERIKDCLAVILPNGAVLATVRLVDLKTFGELGLLGLTMAYTAWRWRRDSFVICQSCRDGRMPVICPLPPRKRPWFCPRKV